jgi:hypothetical protein
MSGIESNKKPGTPVFDSNEAFLATLKSVDRKDDFLAYHKSQDFDSIDSLFHQRRNTTNKTQPNDLNSFQRYLSSIACHKSQDFDSDETLFHQTRNSTNTSQPNDPTTASAFNSMDRFLACLTSRDFDSTQIPSLHGDYLQSLDFPNNAIFNSRSWAYGVHSLSISDDLTLGGKMPLNGSAEASNVQDQPWASFLMEAMNRTPLEKTLQLPKLEAMNRTPLEKTLQLPKLQLPTVLPKIECIPSCNEAALQEVLAQPSTNTVTNKRRRVYKGRKVVPETKVYVESYNDEDVISGRGARTNKHSGNRYYLELVEKRKPAYRQASDKDKRDIVTELIKRIHARNGRFLEMEPAPTESWYVSHEKRTYIKVSQALRDRNDEESRAAKRAKYPKSAQPRKAKKAIAYDSVNRTAV